MNQRWRGGEEIEKKDYLILANVLKNGKPQAGECVSSILPELPALSTVAGPQWALSEGWWTERAFEFLAKHT